MGAAASRLFLLTQVSLVLLCNTWITLRTGQTVYESLFPPLQPSPRSAHHGSLSHSGHQISVRKDRNKAKWTLCITLLSCLFFLMSMISVFIGNVLTLNHLGWMDGTQWQNIDNRARQVGRPFRYGSMICQLLGYSTMIVVCYLRLFHIFLGSQHAISDRTDNLVRSVILGGLVMVFAAVAVHFWVDPTAALLVGLAPVLAYPSIAVWTSLRFLSTSMRIAREVHSSLPTKELLNASSRLALVSLLAICSSLLTFVSFVAAVLTGYTSGVAAVFGFLWNLDSLISSACLMFTLKQHARYYLFVLGWLHSRLVSGLVKRMHSADLQTDSPVLSVSKKSSDCP